MEIIFFSMAGICAIYFIIIVAYSGISTPFCGIWLILAAVFMMMGAFRARSHAKKGSMPRRLPIFVYTSFMMALCIFGATMYLVVSGTRQRPEGGLDYVVVVGDRVYDEGISNALSLKLDRAMRYARETGYPEVYGISTDTDPILYPHECVKESCALVGDILTGGI